MKRILPALLSLTLAPTATAASIEERLQQLEQRVTELETAIDVEQSRNRWKESIFWLRLKKDMSQRDVRQILGTPGRIEEQIFTPCYYHPTSKIHSFVWFDEDKVLGWTAPAE